MLPDLFTISKPEDNLCPIILHLPHSGTFIPEKIKLRLEDRALSNLDDTDWYLDLLYSFSKELGITMIKANYHRWVVDLNRDPESKPLYSDGRVITHVVPQTDFNGNKLYKTGSVTETEIESRVEKYHSKYFQQLNTIIQEMLDQFGRVLIWDGHSIRRNVPGIQKDPFPDLILGTNEGKSAPQVIIKGVEEKLEKSGYEYTIDHPFKGGFITRSLPVINKSVYTLQMEMSKDLYMSQGETSYNEEKAEIISSLFKKIISRLIELL